MSRAPHSTLTNLRQTVDDLQHQLTERTAQRDTLQRQPADAGAQQAATAEVLGSSTPRPATSRRLAAESGHRVQKFELVTSSRTPRSVLRHTEWWWLDHPANPASVGTFHRAP
jgi:hypothetical protein